VAEAGFNHSIEIYTGSCGSLKKKLYSNMTGSTPGGTETIPSQYISDVGTTYYVYIADYRTAGTVTQTGTFTISRTCAPSAPTSCKVTLEPGAGSVMGGTELIGSTVTLPTPTVCTGWTFAGWKAGGAQSETTSAPTLIPAGSYTPSSDETLYAVYSKTEGSGNSAITLDFEGAGTFPYNSDWTLSSGLSLYTANSKTGSNSCRTTTATSTIRYNKKIEGKLISVKYYAGKTTSNTTATNLLVETSADGSTWTQRHTFLWSGAPNGSFTEVTADLSSLNLSNVYVRLSKTGSSTAVRMIDDITIAVDGGSNIIYDSNPAGCCSLTPSNLVFGVATVNKTIDESSFSLIPTNGNGSTISYKSSDPGIASVNASGKVTFHSNGSVTITATQEATATHCGSSASYTLAISGDCVSAGDVIFSEDFSGFSDVDFSRMSPPVSGLPNGGTNGGATTDGDWIAECGHQGSEGGSNYFGIRNQRFQSNGVRGITNCGSANGGYNDNYLTSRDIDLTAYAGGVLTLSYEFEVAVGTLEGLSGGSYACGATDEAESAYRFDNSGPWQIIDRFYGDGGVLGDHSQQTGCIALPETGVSSVQVRFKMGTQSQSEYYYLDNIKLTAIKPVMVAGNDDDECLEFGGTMQLNCATVGGSWWSSDETIATVDDMGLVTAVGEGTAIISYKLGCCAVIKEICVKADACAGNKPVIGKTITDVCVGTTVDLNDTNSGATWASRDESKATVDAAGVVTGKISGAVWIINENAAGCFDSIQVTVKDKPDVLNFPKPDKICEGTALTLTVPSVDWNGNETPTKITGWEIRLGSWVTFDPATVMVYATYNDSLLRYRAENSCGASYSNTHAIRLDEAVTATAGSVSNVSCICTSMGTTTATAIMAATVPSVATATGTWSVIAAPAGVNMDNFDDENSAVTDINNLPVGDYTFRWTVENGECSAFDDVSFSIAPDIKRPKFTLSKTTENADASAGICTFKVPDLSGLVTAQSDNCTAVTGLTYTQTPVAGTVITSNQVVSVTYTDECGNDSTQTVTVTIPAALTVAVTDVIINPDCNAAVATLTVGGGTTAYQYSLDSIAGPSATWNNMAATTASIANLTIDTLVYIKDANGCVVQTTIDVTIPVVPTLNFPSINPVCENNAVITLVASNDASIAGVFSGTGVTGTSFNPKEAGEGLHTITYTVNQGGCIHTDTEEIKVYGLPTASVMAIPTCPGESFDFKANGGATYQWTVDGAAISEIGDTYTYTNTTLPGQQIPALVYAISAHAQGGCRSDNAAAVTAAIPSAPHIIGDLTHNFCVESGTVNVTSLVTASSGSLVWYASSAGGAVISPQAIRKTVTGTTSFFVAAKSAGYDCLSAIEQVDVTINELPMITEINASNKSNSTIEIAGGTMPYTCILDGETSGFTSASLDLGYLSVGKHHVQIIDDKGCKAETAFHIDEIEMIPNKFFTPNSDGENDRWYITNVEFYPESQVHIYDRHGKELASYTAREFINNKGWDGMYWGKQMTATDYWYVIEVHETAKRMTGHFLLRR
jgi:gliding motility-associated-like protein